MDLKYKGYFFKSNFGEFRGIAAYSGLDFSNDDSLGNVVLLLVNDDIKLVDWVDIVRSVGVTDRGVPSHTPHL